MFLFQRRGLFCQVTMTFLLCHYDLSTRSFQLVTGGGVLPGHHDLSGRLLWPFCQIIPTCLQGGEVFSFKSSYFVWWCMNICLKKSVSLDLTNFPTCLLVGGDWLKLSNQEPGQYLGGWPLGNTSCCRCNKGHFGRFAAIWDFACSIK